MKVFIIKYSNDTYKGLDTRLPQGWRLRRFGMKEYKTVSNIDNAIHYTSAKKANAVITGFARNVRSNIERNNTVIAADPSKKSYSYKYAVEQNTAYQAILDTYGAGEIIELECEKDDSNIRAVDNVRIKFKTDHSGNPIKGTYKITTENYTRHYCKVCGVILKNIPQVTSYNMYAMRICCKCGIALGEQCKVAWDAIEEERRKSLDNDFFLHNLG